MKHDQTRGWALDRVHNSRRPLDRLFAFFDYVTLTFDLVLLIGGQDIVTDYLCAKFGDFSFSRFGFIVRTDRQIYLLTEAHDCYTHATTVGVSKECLQWILINGVH